MKQVKRGAFVTLRRKGVVERLEVQLNRGSKPSKDDNDKLIPLTEKDINRIEREISVLKVRIA